MVVVVEKVDRVRKGMNMVMWRVKRGFKRMVLRLK